MTNIHNLPEDCLSKILSLTSPMDIFRLSDVSKQFLSASKSDTVWNRFLPSDCNEIVSRSLSLIPHDQFTSKKDVFVYLCRYPILLDNNTKSFALYKRNGKKCYMLGARALTITSGDNPVNWSWESVPNESWHKSWTPVPKSRFPECAVLKGVHMLEIEGKIQTALLSPRCVYDVFFVFKFNALYPGYTSDTTGFERVAVTVGLSIVGEDGLPRGDYNQAHDMGPKTRYLKTPGPGRWNQKCFGKVPLFRRDGWMETFIGSIDGGQKVVLEMSLKEVKSAHLKRDLVVYGFEIRPFVYWKHGSYYKNSRSHNDWKYG